MPRTNPLKTCSGCQDLTIRKALTTDEQCNRCRKLERNRIWREQNPGVMAANAKRWRDAGNKTVHPEGYAEEQRQRERARYRNDPEARERIKAATRQRRIDNPEKVKAEFKAWVEQNRPAYRKYLTDYAFNRRRNDPELPSALTRRAKHVAAASLGQRYAKQ